MKAYIILIVSVVCIISILVVVMPNGKMKNICCICLSFIITLTLLTPLKNYYQDFLFKEESTEYDSTLEDVYNNDIYNYIVKNILNKENIPYLDVKCNFVKDKINVIKKIGIKLDKSVISTQEQHINITIKIKKILSSKLIVEESQIYFYE